MKIKMNRKPVRAVVLFLIFYVYQGLCPVAESQAQNRVYPGFDLVIFEEKILFTRELSPLVTMLSEHEKARQLLEEQAPHLHEGILFMVDFLKFLDVTGWHDQVFNCLIVIGNLDVSEGGSLDPAACFELRSEDVEAALAAVSQVEKTGTIYKFSDHLFFSVKNDRFVFVPHPDRFGSPGMQLPGSFNDLLSRLPAGAQHYLLLKNNAVVKDILIQQAKEVYLVEIDRYLEQVTEYHMSGNQQKNTYRFALDTGSRETASELKSLLHGYRDIWLALHRATGRTVETHFKRMHTMIAPLMRTVEALEFSMENSSVVIIIDHVEEHLKNLQEQQCVNQRMPLVEACMQYLGSNPETTRITMDLLIEKKLMETRPSCPVSGQEYSIGAFEVKPTDEWRPDISVEVICPVHSPLTFE